LLASTTEVQVKPGHALIAYGRLDDNIYILKKGIVRYCWFDGSNERTYGFAMPGSLMISYHSYYMRQPSFFQLEACREKVIALRLPKKELDNLIDTSHEVAKWMLHISLGQLHINEIKLSVINGNARERFEAMVRTRNEIMAGVSMRTIASYLGITPAYLSRLKKNMTIDVVQRPQDMDPISLYKYKSRIGDADSAAIQN
jgi:CRP-like cAMP-binding protein